MTQPVTTIEKFDLHPAVALSLIKSQAATLSKALTEAIMNSADANSTRVDISITPDRIIISDNGAGFASLDDIEQYFSRIGTPHVEGDAKHGRFRLGRCQLFAFGANLWRSNTFRMYVNVRDRGISHDIYRDEPHCESCVIEIELYDALTDNDILHLVHDLKGAIKWVDMTIAVNGVQITEDKSKTKWTVETEDAWILTKRTNTLYVYNQGVFLKTFWAYGIGVGGIIITKKALATNAARNDIHDTSQTWKDILALAKEHAPAPTNSKTSEETQLFRVHDAATQTYYVRRFLDGEFTVKDLLRKDARLFCSASGGWLTLAQVSQPPGMTLTCMPTRTPEGEMLERSSLATVIIEKTLEDFRVESLSKLLGIIVARAVDEAETSKSARLQRLIADLKTLKCVDQTEFAEIFEQNYAEIPDHGLTEPQRHGLTQLRRMSELYAATHSVRERPIIAATSVTRGCWTDGDTIWFNADNITFQNLSDVVWQASQIISSYASKLSNRDSIFPGKDEAYAFLSNMCHDDAAATLVRDAIAGCYKHALENGKTSMGTISLLSKYDTLCATMREPLAT